MRFLITRTSAWSDSQPCPEAVPFQYASRTVYTYKSLKQAQTDNRDQGREFELFEGVVCSPPYTVDGWAVDLHSLEDLIELQEAHGSLIVDFSFPAQMPTIEIYDDYRE